MQMIRYSEAFKRQVVREIEDAGLLVHHASIKYGIRGKSTVRKWTVKYGNGTHGKVIRVETPDEINELARLKKEVKKLKEALADAHMDAKLSDAFLDIACKRLGEPVDAFKKKADGKPPTKP